MILLDYEILADHECRAIDHGVGCPKLARWYCVPFPFDASLPVKDRGLMVCDDHVVSHGLSHSRAVLPSAGRSSRSSGGRDGDQS